MAAEEDLAEEETQGRGEATLVEEEEEILVEEVDLAVEALVVHRRGHHLVPLVNTAPGKLCMASLGRI